MADIQAGTVSPFKAFQDKFSSIPGRMNAQTQDFIVNFEFGGGGMGDYICWTPALRWVVENCPWVHGRIWAPSYFIEFPRHFFAKQPKWEVDLVTKYPREAVQGTLQRGLLSTPAQLLNATGTHLLKQGFHIFANLDPMPVGTTYPELDLSNQKLPRPLRGLEKKYVVFTPGGTTKSRFVPAKYWNPLVRWVKEQGLTPVFLGKAHMVDVHTTYFDNDVLYSEGIDLREKTGLLEAAKVMEEAACTIGLDNGLLHLASCTTGNVVFAYNVASPQDRRPVRRFGKLIEITVDEKRLGCIHCQSRYKLLYTHNFKNCVWNDQACIDILFENEGEHWKNAILQATA